MALRLKSWESPASLYPKRLKWRQFVGYFYYHTILDKSQNIAGLRQNIAGYEVRLHYYTNAVSPTSQSIFSKWPWTGDFRILKLNLTAFHLYVKRRIQ